MTKNNDVVVVTTTFYRPGNESDQVRQAIAERTFRLLNDSPYRVIAVDGGSPTEVLNRFRDYGVEVLAQEQPGMGNSRRQAMRTAEERNPQAIVWMEPEKKDYVKSIADSVDSSYR